MNANLVLQAPTKQTPATPPARLARSTRPPSHQAQAAQKRACVVLAMPLTLISSCVSLAQQARSKTPRKTPRAHPARHTRTPQPAAPPQQAVFVWMGTMQNHPPAPPRQWAPGLPAASSSRARPTAQQLALRVVCRWSVFACLVSPSPMVNASSAAQTHIKTQPATARAQPVPLTAYRMLELTVFLIANVKLFTKQFTWAHMQWNVTLSALLDLKKDLKTSTRVQQTRSQPSVLKTKR